MNSKRSMMRVLLGVGAVSLLVTNCVLKTDGSDDNNNAGASNNNSAGASNNNSAGAGNAASGECSPVGKKFNGCICSDKSISYQTCLSDGTYGNCVCATNSEGGASSNGGASSTGGSYSAGRGGAAADAGSFSTDAGAGGEGGAADAAVLDCYGCLIERCGPEWGACTLQDENNPDPDFGEYCLSSGAANAAPGQIEDIISCITTERASGLAKRDVVRACGSSLGASASPDFFVWAPRKMTPETEALMNCMADSPDELTPGAWATDMPKNYPASGPRPWDAMTCAKDACTAPL